MTTTDPTADVDIDEQAAEEFAGRLLELFTGATLSCPIDIGRRTGLFDAATRGPATSDELANRASLQERYVREWLGAMATAGIFEYERSTATYWLPREHAACLSGDGPENLSGVALLTTILANHVPAVTEAFRHGGGVPYEAYVPEIHEALDALWGPIYAELLVPAYLPLAPGLPERLSAGARAADVGCGTDNALLVLASTFPASTFIGYDLDDAALDRARIAAAARGLTNVTFQQADAADLEVDRPFDVVFVFNSIHDQARPAAVLGQIHDALVPGGMFVMDEPRVSSRLEDNRFEASEAFPGPSLYFHERALARRRLHPDVASLLADDLFFEYVYAVLPAWGMHRMGNQAAKVGSFSSMVESFRACRSLLESLWRCTITDIASHDAGRVADEVWEVVSRLQVSTSGTRIVAGSKALHHVLPDLVPPIDREYTFRLFTGQKSVTGGEARAFREWFPYFCEIGRRCASDIEAIIDRGGFMATGRAKVIDNAIMGFTQSRRSSVKGQNDAAG